MATFIADILASSNFSFGQLNQILSTDISTAEEVLPVLILCLLQSESKNATETRSKDTLSEYFAKILTVPGVSLATVKCVVEVIIHLRYFKKDKDILSCNRWLDLNFLLLAKNAVRCGAYTTALLFLELAAESGPFSPADSASAEQIQYEIYAHIDEPDGFYGIQTQNLQQFLIQRLHHEQQWDKAFRFHGAMLEAHSANPTSEDMSGLLQSFHSFGFNRLALKTLQLSDARAVSNETAMSYKLGWRSETWDLPDRDAYTPGAPLYNAIRAIYRERNSRTVDSLLTRSLYKEMDRLRSLGIESIAEIRGVLQSLMCLNQLARWNNGTMTQSQPANTIDISQMNDFTVISPEFE
jgi:ataxia telangiectasia mutated family protein